MKLHGKNEVYLIIDTVWVISKNIGIEFGMDKCSAVRIK